MKTIIWWKRFYVTYGYTLTDLASINTSSYLHQYGQNLHYPLNHYNLLKVRNIGYVTVFHIFSHSETFLIITMLGCKFIKTSFRYHMYILSKTTLPATANKSLPRGGWTSKKNIFFMYSNANFAKWSSSNLKKRQQWSNQNV